MPSSLSNLAANLVTPNLTKFRETAKVFRPVDMSLVTRKGVYPYEYTDSWEKLDETSLPSMNNFYSSLTESNIDNTEYQHALEVWKHFKCKTLGEYSDLYLKIDVLLLVEVFENFRDICLKAYCIDPAYYYTAPGMAYDCMLKKTAIKLELLTDYDMVLAFEKGKNKTMLIVIIISGIRGGLVQASMRYAKANHEKAPDFDSRKPNAWLVYQDCNNLYGWAMSEYMPFGDFKWVEPSLSGLDDLDDTSPIGRIYEVDMIYPQELHDHHNDLPFLPENGIPAESKKKYIVHYRNLQQAIKNGLKVEKVHRVLQFKQSPWLAEYISMNTEMRKSFSNL